MIVEQQNAVTRLQNIEQADFSVQYLTQDAEIKDRVCLLFSRIVKWLHLDQMDWVQAIFPKVDMEKAGQVVVDVVTILDEVTDPEVVDLIERVVAKVNQLFQHIQLKRNSDTVLLIEMTTPEEEVLVEESAPQMSSPTSQGIQVVDPTYEEMWENAQEYEEVPTIQPKVQKAARRQTRLTNEQRKEIREDKRKSVRLFIENDN